MSAPTVRLLNEHNRILAWTIALAVCLSAEVPGLADLPLVEVPATSAASPFLAVHISGDGGWGVTDRGLSGSLAREGIPVIGLNSLKYFWTRRTPDSAAADLERAIQHYLAIWHRERLVLIGYSLGADVLPFMFNRMSEEVRKRVDLIVLMGPSPMVDFKFHLTDWLGNFNRKNALPVLPEIEKIENVQILCIQAEEDKDNICNDIDRGEEKLKMISLPGGHRFGRNFAPLAKAILEELASITPPR